MDHLKNKTIKDFRKGMIINKDNGLDLNRKIFSSFHRAKPGCYCPLPYQLKYRRLSEVLKKTK